MAFKRMAASVAARQAVAPSAMLAARGGVVLEPPSARVIVPEGARSISLQIVKQRMRSVGNIGKITKAMKMVAASRLRGAQDKMTVSRGIVTPFAAVLPDSPAATVENTTVVPVTSDKGLCGGINTQIVKFTGVMSSVAEAGESKVNLTVVGEKGRSQLVRGANRENISTVVVDAFKATPTFAAASLIADAVLESGFDKAHILFNQFKSAIAFKPTISTVLSPAALDKVGEEAGLPIDQYEIEGPDRSEFLLDLYEFQTACYLYHGMLENATSELGSRMQSMDNSSKNAGEMLAKLTLTYNRTRQAAITTELIEIISGASALEG